MHLVRSGKVLLKPHGQRSSPRARSAQTARYSATGPLALTFQSTLPAPRETFPSFFSRLAATKGTSSTDFAIDMGLSLKRVWEMHPSAVEAVALWGRLSDSQMIELISWTGQRIGNVRMTFRDEVFVSRALRSPTMRGCPACLREDLEARGGSPSEAMAMRGDWQLRDTGICLRHCCPLVTLWQADDLAARYDFQSRLAEIRDDVVSHRLDGPRAEPTTFDRWLEGRLNRDLDSTWLSNQSLYASVTFCRLLGAEISSIRSSLKLGPRDTLRAAQYAGFEIAKNGEKAISDALDELAVSIDKSSGEPQKAFGNLYVKLRSDHIDDDQFLTFRKLLRDCILRHWPVADGEEVLGQTLPKRLLHSWTSAAQCYGVDRLRMQRLLVEIGALYTSDTRSPNRQTFDAAKYGPAIDQLSSLVSQNTLRKSIGASRGELEALISEGLLVPFSQAKDVRLAWRLSDGIEFVAELRRLSVALDEEAEGWEPVLMARSRTGVTIANMLAAVRSGSICLRSYSTLQGFGSFSVSKTEIDGLKARELRNRESFHITAAEFGRVLGYRQISHLEALVRGGHTPGTWRKRQNSKLVQLCFTQEDVAAFHRRFVTVSSFGRELNVSRNTIRFWFNAARLRPFAPGGGDLGMLFLREDAERAKR